MTWRVIVYSLVVLKPQRACLRASGPSDLHLIALELQIDRPAKIQPF